MRNLCSFFYFFIVIFFAGNISSITSKSPISICITNCVQCKKMYGQYFDGKICGDACVESDGQLVPDCNNPGSIGSYLKRLL